jgi:putative endonuclease
VASVIPNGPTDRRQLGVWGEQMAAEWYEEHGYVVMARNWRCDMGELDLVCRKEGVLVVCEVKTRRTDTFGSPAEAVTAGKQRRIRQLAARWLREHPLGYREIRFDVASVDRGALRVIEGAF